MRDAIDRINITRIVKYINMQNSVLNRNRKQYCASNTMIWVGKEMGFLNTFKYCLTEINKDTFH